MVTLRMQKTAAMKTDRFRSQQYALRRLLFLPATLPATLAIALSVLPAPAWSAPMAYPANGQSDLQQVQDEGACRAWAQEQTGFDPNSGPVQVQNYDRGGQVAKGAFVGSFLGVIGGAIGGSAGTGAAVGAGVGAASGLLRKGSQRRKTEKEQIQANTDYEQQLVGYNQAYTACMQGRGYTVS